MVNIFGALAIVYIVYKLFKDIAAYKNTLKDTLIVSGEFISFMYVINKFWEVW